MEIVVVVQVAAQRRFAAGEPEVCDGRHRARNSFDLRKRHVARLVGFVPVKTGRAPGVAARGDEQDQRAETPFAFSRAKQLKKFDCSVCHWPLSAARRFAVRRRVFKSRGVDDDSFRRRFPFTLYAAPVDAARTGGGERIVEKERGGERPEEEVRGERRGSPDFMLSLKGV